MPRIKGYDSQVSPVGPIGGQRASGASPIAGAVAGLGDVADRIDRAQRQREISELNVKAAEAQGRWESQSEEMLRTAEPGADVASAFVERFDEDMDTVFGQTRSPEARMFVGENRAKMRAHFLQKIQRGQAALAGAAAVEGHQVSLRADAGALLKNPDGFDIALERRTTKLAGDVAAGLIPPIKAQELRGQDASELAVAAMNGRIDIAGRVSEGGSKGVRAALDALDDARGQIGDGTLAKHIDADTQAVLLGRIERERDRILSEQDRRAREAQSDARAIVSQNMSDELASIDLTGKSAGLVTPELIRRAYPDDKDMATRLIGKLENAQRFYNTRQQVALTPPEQDAAILTELAAQAPGVNAVQKAQQLGEVQRALRAKYTALREDPFGYILSVSPSMAREGAAAQESGDRNAFRAFLAKADAVQAQMGVPDYARRFMGKDQAAGFVARVNVLPAEQAADQMEILRGQYEDRWPEVIGEMVDADLAPAFVTLAGLDRPQDAVVRADLAVALQTGATELKRNVGANATAVSDAVHARMADYAATRQFDGARGQKMLNGDRESATMLAYSYYQRNGGDVHTAAKDAVAALFDSRYDYNETYRVPKGRGGVVENNIRATLSALKPEDFPMAETQVEGLSEDYRRRANWLEASRGAWANITVRGPGDTEPRGGVELLYPNGSPVLLANGQRVRVMFDDEAAPQRTAPFDPAAPLIP